MGYDDYYNWKNIIGNDVGYTKEDNQKLVNCLMTFKIICFLISFLTG